MNPIEICVAFIVAVVSIGTPLVFQVVSKFDEKYNSEKIIELFKKESGLRYFKPTIVVSLIAVLFYIVDTLFLAHDYNVLGRKSLFIISIILIILTILLLSFFIFFSFKVLKYSIPSTFIRDRMNRLQQSKVLTEKEEYLLAVQDYFKYSIKNGLVDAYRLLPDYFTYVFINYKKVYKSETVVYAQTYYLIVYEITRTIASQAKNNSNRLLNDHASGFNWFVGTVESSRISSETYSWLWANLRVLIENKSDESIVSYWAQACRHLLYNFDEQSFALSQSSMNIDSKAGTLINNREEFVDFHYYLGGLLLYKNRNECIKRIWNYTTNYPPKYPLLPSTLDEIFNKYFELCKNYDPVLMDKTVRYRFPDVESIGSEWIIQHSIQMYLMLLFLRQYILHEFYTYQNYFASPLVPKSQMGKKHWIDNIRRLRSIFDEVFNDNKLKKELSLDFISEDWCRANNKKYPYEIIDELENKLNLEFIKTKKEQPIDKGKERKFYESSSRILESTIKLYDPIKNENPNEIENKYSIKIKGHFLLLDKSDVARNQEYDNLNFDSVLAQRISEIIKIKISESFLLAIKQKLVFPEEEIFNAIDKLGVTKDPSEYIIVSFQQNPSYYKERYKIEQLGNNNYKGIQLVNYNICNPDLIAGTQFILKKSDLPSFVFNVPGNSYNLDYQREEIVTGYKIFASLIDLYKEKETRTFLEQRFKMRDYEDKVFAVINIDFDINWSKMAKVCAIKSVSSKDKHIITNKLEEVKLFEEI